MRLLRGEDLESVSRAVGITAARASHWRAQFLAAGQAGLKSCAPDARDGIVKLSGIAMIDPQYTGFARGLEPIILGVGQPDSA